MCESHARNAAVRDPRGVFAWCGAGPRADVPRGPRKRRALGEGPRKRGALGEGPASPPLRPALVLCMLFRYHTDSFSSEITYMLKT